MVHRAPDSRLLANLLAHEKEYAKHLAGLFPLSHSALASLSAYAAASPPQPSSPAQPIAAVVDVLTGADDALQRYNHAIDGWREQLASLKNLEDDLTAILRDREILVTRLIKASKSSRDAHRSSRLITPLTGLGSASLSSLPSSNSTTVGSSSGPASTNSKLAQAQTELQACETHLVTKENELDARRISLAREGLGARCRALIDCGWVWTEMGKQGLKALQALSAHVVAPSDHIRVSSSTPTPAIPPHLNLNPTYASDSSSLTPSQSASQTAARSAEASHEGPTSKEHERATETEAESQSKSKAPPGQVRTARAPDDDGLTIALPPAHSISESVLPVGVRPQAPQNGDLATQKQVTPDAGLAPTPAPRRRRSRRPRRPPSQHITEVSDEGSDGPSSSSNINTGTNGTVNANANLGSSTPRATFPTIRADPGKDDSSSEDDLPARPIEIVENNPFEVIRRSMLGPSASTPFLPAAPSAPIARASVPDVRESETSPSKTGVFTSSGPGPRQPLGPGTAKRERRTSIAFFGSIRGLFRKPKDRGKVSTEWDEDQSSPPPSSPNRPRTKASGKGGGWVTRTDARIKRSKGMGEDSDEEATPTQTQAQAQTTTIVTATSASNMARRVSGTRLHKGRPGGSSARGIHENGSSSNIPVVPARSVSTNVGTDGWVTDTPVGAGSGMDDPSSRSGDAGQGRLRTRRGTTKRKKTSVADLRGNDQGHTDGEVDGRRVREPQSLERVPGKSHEVPVSVPESKPGVDSKEARELARRGSTSKGMPTDADPIADPDTSISISGGPGNQHRRATTATATSGRRLSSNGAPTHRRSASLSLVPMHVPSIFAPQGSHTTTSTSGPGISWRKPPPQIEPQTEPESPSRLHHQTQPESQPKQNVRRQLSNGHATAHKHAQNQSLMSIVADVARLNENGNQGGDRDRDKGRDRAWLGAGSGVGTDKTRSLDIPRAPGSVLRDADRESSGAEKAITSGANGRGHARALSSPMELDEIGRGGENGGQGAQRPIKMPLRSALRNATRTPSPSPAPLVAPTPVTAPAVVPVKNVPGAKTEVVPVAQAAARPARGDEDRDVISPSLRDSASISSYETGRESLYVEDVQSQSPSPATPIRSPSPPLRSHSRSPPLRSQSYSPTPRSQSPKSRSHSPPPPPLLFTFPPPPVEPPPVSVSAPAPRGETTQQSSSQPPSSNVSTDTPPARRKSVRMSLQPTFSPTPPALCDEDGEDYAPWSKSFATREEEGTEGEPRGRKTKKGRKGASVDTTVDMWADSSEEDEVYSSARRLLASAGKQDKTKGKGKARAKT